MTVQDTQNYVEYIADGLQTSFSFNFRADDDAWVVLSHTDDLESIDLNEDQVVSPGGSVVYTVAPVVNTTVRISRVTPQAQDFDHTRYGPFDSESAEDTYDKIVMMVQDLDQKIADIQAQLDELTTDIFAWQFVDFTGDRTLQYTDRFKMLRSLDNGGTQNVTVPPNSSVAFELGTQISFKQDGSSILGFIEGAGVTIDTPESLTVNSQKGTVTLIKDSMPDGWTLLGNIAAL